LLNTKILTVSTIKIKPTDVSFILHFHLSVNSNDKKAHKLHFKAQKNSPARRYRPVGLLHFTC